MRADIAIGQRAEDGVGDGVHQNVGVGMALELAVVRDGDAPEPDRVARFEGVDVVSLTRPDVRQVAHQAGFGAGQIVGRRDLHVGRVPLEHMHGMACGLGHSRVVGQCLTFRGPMRLEDQGKLERLRGLNRAQAGPLGRGDDHASGVHGLDRVRDWMARDCGPVPERRRTGSTN